MTLPPFTLDPTLSAPLESTGDDGARSWSFPTSWKDEEIAAFVELREWELVEEELAAEQERLARAPARLIEAKTKELAKKRAARVAAERDVAEDVIYEAAVAEHGGEHRVGRIRTPDGSIGAQFEHTMIVTRGQPIIIT